jgi:dipeptide/tripeptide permease
MDKDQNIDDGIAGAGEIRNRLPEPADAAIEDGRAPAFILPSHFIARFFESHPVGFWFFFWGELAERSSYYGMKAILTLYMGDRLNIKPGYTVAYMAFFSAGCYFLPLLGGWVADRFFGKYWTIVGFSLPYILGHFILGVEDFWFMVFALVLLAMGSGVIKPNISTLMGLTYDQQRPGQTHLRGDAFAMFYGAINIGAALSQLAMPWIRTHYGYQIAFLFPAGLMAVSFAVFAAGKPFYAKETIGYKPVNEAERETQWKVLLQLLGLFVLVMFFWAVFDQAASTWILFGNLYMDCSLFGYKVDPDAIQAANPIFIIVLLPLMQVLWRVLQHNGIKVRATDKMIAGFVLTAVTLGIMSGAAAMAGPVEPAKRPKVNEATGQVETKNGEPVMEEWVRDDHKVTVWWEVLAFFVLTISEILLSVTGLELAYAAAPKSMTGFVTACWLATVGAANLFINTWAGFLYEMFRPSQYFAGLAAVLLLVAGAFYFVARQFNQVTEKAEAEAAALAGFASDSDGGTGIIQGQTKTGLQDKP